MSQHSPRKCLFKGKPEYEGLITNQMTSYIIVAVPRAHEAL